MTTKHEDMRLKRIRALIKAGYTHEEIAAVMGIDHVTATKLVMQALTKFGE